MAFLAAKIMNTEFLLRGCRFAAALAKSSNVRRHYEGSTFPVYIYMSGVNFLKESYGLCIAM